MPILSQICLEVKVGKGPASVPFPILLEDMSFKGRMRIKLKLMSAFPHVQASTNFTLHLIF